MKLSTPLLYSGNPREAADQVAGLEKAGLDTVWVAEAYGFDSPTLMGYLAAKTETAELADGWLPFLFLPEKAHEVWGDALAKGTTKRSPDLAPLEVSAGGMVAIGEGEDTKKLLDLMRPMYALYVGGMGARGKNFYN